MRWFCLFIDQMTVGQTMWWTTYIYCTCPFHYLGTFSYYSSHYPYSSITCLQLSPIPLHHLFHSLTAAPYYLMAHPITSTFPLSDCFQLLLISLPPLFHYLTAFSYCSSHYPHSSTTWLLSAITHLINPSLPWSDCFQLSLISLPPLFHYPTAFSYRSHHYPYSSTTWLLSAYSSH